MKDPVSGSTYLALVDGSGSVVGLAGSDGVVEAVYENDPFGRLLAAEEAQWVADHRSWLQR